MKTHKGKCKKTNHYGVMVCSSGCDCLLAREAEKKHAEKVTGVKYNQPFFVLQGLELIASGGEVPDVLLRAGDFTLRLEEAQLRVLSTALDQAFKWCKDGYCEGIC